MERKLANAIEKTERTLKECRRLIARSKRLIEQFRSAQQVSYVPTQAKTRAPYVPPNIHTLRVDPSIASSPDPAFPDPSQLPSETETRQTKAKVKGQF
jgi:hypothetical protein